LYDLKSNACLFLSDFKCAVDALETMYATDSTKADTLFYTKISAAAAEGEKPDTVRLLKWTQIATRKYPDNMTLLGYLNRAYSLAGPVDSVVSVTNRIIAKDTTAVVPALEAAKALVSPPAHALSSSSVARDTTAVGAAPLRGRPKEALPFLEFAIKHGDAQAKENAAALLYTGAAPLLQEPQDLEGAAELLRLAVQSSNPSGKVYPAANYLLGLAMLFQVPALDKITEKQKSCDMARQEEGMLLAADSALTAGRPVNPEAVDKNLDIIKKYKPRIASMLKAYCKGR
jgi:TPR repeat protein